MIETMSSWHIGSDVWIWDITMVQVQGVTRLLRNLFKHYNYIRSC